MHLKLGALDSKGDYNVIIEIPAKSRVKYDIDQETGLLYVDRFLPTSFVYPCNYGSIPGTLAGDGDPVDALVLCSEPVAPGCLMKVRIIGMLETEDESGVDEKVLCLPFPKADMMYAAIQSLEDLAPIELKKIEHFFTHYKGLEAGKWVKVGKWQGIPETKALIQKSIEVFAAKSKL